VLAEIADSVPLPAGARCFEGISVSHSRPTVPLVCHSSSYRYDRGCAYCYASGDNNLLSNEVLQKVLSLTTPMTIILNGDWCCKTTLPETAHQVSIATIAKRRRRRIMMLRRRRRGRKKRKTRRSLHRHHTVERYPLRWGRPLSQVTTPTAISGTALLGSDPPLCGPWQIFRPNYGSNVMSNLAGHFPMGFDVSSDVDTFYDLVDTAQSTPVRADGQGV
jgi:hypothetical protein